ncbi:hypothetical protein V6U90_08815 [Micromonospora sp. CPCC 206060]|uniref:hypothetical protein n=1 Tax=Micromonospora sp. CPCC 206060 TaxID=3122406 RepID=UPI002FF3BD29
MSTFEEYAALARHLSELRRTGERNAAADTRRRSALQGAVDQLGHRLAGQEVRLRQLRQVIREPAVPAVPRATAGTPGEPVPAVPGDGPPPAGAAPQPAYPELPNGSATLALPTSPVPTVPAPRPPAELDPAAELDRARQAADAAEAALARTEALGQQPLLLPGLSPLARALAVYAGCLLATAPLMLMLDLGYRWGAIDTFTQLAWTLAGLPTLAFFAGYLLLGRYGQPPLVVGTPPRYRYLGFLVTFIGAPVLYCGFIELTLGG